MKKVLFLTTALIATGSMAAADVRISGYGRFGLDYNEANDDRLVFGGLAPDGDADGLQTGTPLGGTQEQEINITSRLRLQFDYSAETDGGVSFGARSRFQIESRDNDPNSGADMNGARFFASYGGFTVAAGNILGAVEAMQGLYLETRTAGAGIDGMGFNSVVGNMGYNFFDWDSYSSTGGGVNGVEAIYNADNWGAHISYSKGDDSIIGISPVLSVVDGEENTAISVYYTFGDWTIALGYNDEEEGAGTGTNQDNDMWIVSVQGDLGFAGVRLAYAEMDSLTTATETGLANQRAANLGGMAYTPVAGDTVTDDVSKIGLYGTFDIGAATNLVVFVTDEDNGGAATDGTGYGVHVSHDLGGGVSLEAAVVETSDDTTQAQAGVYFSF